MSEQSINESCCFTGHRPNRFPFGYNEDAVLRRKIKATLPERTERRYRAGARRYWFGGAMGVDLWAAEAVISLKRRCPDISLCCAVPFEGYDSMWRQEMRSRVETVKRACDEVAAVCASYSQDAYKPVTASSTP